MKRLAIASLVCSAGLLICAIACVALISLALTDAKRRINAFSAATTRLNLESESYEAWRFATRWETVKPKILNSNSEPPKNDTLDERDYLVRAYRRSEVFRNGNSEKTGNAKYNVKALLAFHDRSSSELLNRAILSHKKISEDTFEYIRVGEWHCAALECVVHKMDAPGDWVADGHIIHIAGCEPKAEYRYIRHYGEPW